MNTCIYEYYLNNNLIHERIGERIGQQIGDGFEPCNVVHSGCNAIHTSDSEIDGICIC
jgi:hypothetical protein